MEEDTAVMNEKAYRIEVLHFLNPYLIWVEVANVNREIIKFEQIGIYGLVPLECTIDMENDSFINIKSVKWMPAVAKQMETVFSMAQEVYFIPVRIERRSSIFNNNVHKFGEILIKQTNGKSYKLSKFLKKVALAYYSQSTFNDYLSHGKIKTKLDDDTVKVIHKELESALKKRKAQRIAYEKSLKSQTSLFSESCQNLDNIKKLLLTERNLEHHNQTLVKKEEKLKIEKILIHKKLDYEMCQWADDINSVGRGCKTGSSLDSRKNENFASQSQRQPVESDSKKTPENIKKPNSKNDTQIDKKTEELVLIGPAGIDSLKLKPVVVKKYKMSSSTTTKQILSDKTAEEREGQKRNLWQAVDSEVNFPIKTPHCLSQEGKVQTLPGKKLELPQEICTLGSKSPLKILQMAAKRLETPTESEKPRYCKNIGKDVNFDDKTKLESTQSIPNAKQCDLDPDVVLSPNSSILELKLAALKRMNKGSSRNTTPNLKITPKLSLAMDENAYKKRDGQISEGKNIKISAMTSEDEDSHNKKERETYKEDPVFIKKVEFVNKEDRVRTIEESVNKEVQETKKKENSLKHEESISSSNLSVNSKSKTPLDIKNDKIISNVHVNPFKYIPPEICSFVDKIITPKVMVHSKVNCRIEPVLNLQDVNFTPSIRAALTCMSVKKPMMLQTVSWFSILRGYSFFIVSPVNSGKTMGYIPAVCCLVKNEECIDNSSPTCIIMCATAKSAVEIAETCKCFAGRNKSVLAVYAGVDESYVFTTLLNGCDILIATPNRLIWLLDVCQKYFSLKALTMVVLDDCERLDVVYQAELKYFLSKVKKMLKNRVRKEVLVQYIVASRNWCEFMRPLAKTAPNSVVCIGYQASQECVVYSNAYASVNLVLDNNKKDIILKFLKEIDISKRTVIVCCTNQEVDNVSEILKQKKYVVYSVNTETTIEGFYALNAKWSQYCDPVIGPILVCLDENLDHLNITDATYLVHYSLPPLYSRFCNRFSVLIDNYTSIFKQNEQSARIKILVDETNTHQLPKVLNFVKRCTNDIPEHLKTFVQEISIQKDLAKVKNYCPVCDSLLNFGECPDFWNCKKRHTLFQKYDQPPDWLPKSGYITFKILHYHSATHYSVRVLSCMESSKKIKIPQTYSSIPLKMGLHFSNVNNQIPHGIPKLGDVCAVSLKGNYFERCQIIRIINRQENGAPNSILVNLIDEEKFEIAKDIHLFHLPKELQEITSYVVQVRLAGIQPKDKDVEFSDLAKQFLLDGLVKDENIFMRSKVVKVVGRSIIVDNVEACQELKFCNEMVVRYDFKEKLLKSHAIPNEDHIARLNKLFEKSDFGYLEDESKSDNVTESESLEDKFKSDNLTASDSFEDEFKSDNITISETNKESESLKPQWAHLESDDFSQIYFSWAASPDKFFVRLIKFQNCLDRLSDEIQDYAKSYNNELKLDLTDGALVLAKFPDDGLFYRGRIDKLFNGTTSTVECFFVDHGDWRMVLKSDILSLPKNFIKRLPFQAIECRLVGLKPVSQEWSEWATNHFSDLCYQNDSGDLKELYVKYFTTGKAECTEGKKYSVLLIDTSTKNDIIINNVLLESNLAAILKTEDTYLETSGFNIPVQEQSYSEQDFDSKVRSHNEIGNVVNSSPEIKELTDPKEISSKIATPTNKKRLKDCVTTSKSGFNNIEFPDEKSDGSEEWDFQFTKEELKQIFKNRKNENLSIQDNSKTSLALESISTISSKKDSSVSDDSKISSFEQLESCNVNETLDSDDLSCDEDFKTNKKDLRSVDIIQNPTNLINSIPEFKKNALCSTPTTTKISDNVLKKPKILWHQSKKTVTLKIQLATSKYDLNFKARKLEFSSICNDANYYFEIDLYGVIKPGISSHEAKGLYILLKLAKLLPCDWLNLTIKGDEKRWINYDLENISSSSDEDENDDDLKKEFHDSLRKDDSSDDSDDDFVDIKHYDDAQHRYKD